MGASLHAHSLEPARSEAQRPLRFSHDRSLANILADRHFHAQRGRSRGVIPIVSGWPASGPHELGRCGPKGSLPSWVTRQDEQSCFQPTRAKRHDCTHLQFQLAGHHKPPLHLLFRSAYHRLHHRRSNRSIMPTPRNEVGRSPFVWPQQGRHFLSKAMRARTAHASGSSTFIAQNSSTPLTDNSNGRNSCACQSYNSSKFIH